MRHVLMLMAAVVCGIVAFGLNYFYLHMRTQPRMYVAVKEPVKLGTAFSKDLLEPLGIPANITTSAVPYEEVAALYGRAVPRDLKKGELVLWQDVTAADAGMDLRPGENGLHIAVESLRIEAGLLRVGDEVGFVVPKQGVGSAEVNSKAAEQYEQVGPFRIVSINNRIVETPYSSADEGLQSRVATLTVATEISADQRSFADDANRLIQANANEVIRGITFRGRTLGDAALTTRSP